MPDYFQNDIWPWNDEGLYLSDEEQEIADALALRMTYLMSNFSVDIRFAALDAAFELLEQEEREEKAKKESFGINGVEYLS